MVNQLWNWSTLRQNQKLLLKWTVQPTEWANTITDCLLEHSMALNIVLLRLNRTLWKLAIQIRDTDYSVTR